MKRFLLSTFLIILSINAFSQNKNQTINNLKLDNLKLKHQVDSLQKVVDSLQEMVVIVEENAEKEIEAAEDIYTLEHTDSLTNLWYEKTTIKDYDFDLEDLEMDMDSVILTSNIPDSVIIERLRRMNPFITLPFNETVKNYIVLYTEKRKASTAHMLGLSTYYMPIFEEVFDKYGLPLELKYLAVIESALNPTATSRVGARGLWQFMYRTGRSYGLKINSFVDERLDVMKSVDAAARYLMDSYKIFGDWSLAISSYNCGIGNVNKAIRRAGSRNFWDIYRFLPRETRGYMPAFVGAMYAFNYYREYGIVPEDTGMPSATDTLIISKNLHFKQINEVTGIPMEVLKQFNTQYTHDIIPGNEGDCILNIPFSWVPAFMDANQDSLYNHRVNELMSEQVMKNIKASGSETRTAYRVKSGDFLGRIASRYHVTVKQLMSWNHLRSTNLRVGQTIYIYHRGAAPAETKTATATKTTTATPAKAATDSNGEYTTYKVKSGDTLYEIAKKFPGVSAQNIMDFNGIGSKITVGMILRIPKK